MHEPSIYCSPRIHLCNAWGRGSGASGGAHSNPISTAVPLSPLPNWSPPSPSLTLCHQSLTPTLHSSIVRCPGRSNGACRRDNIYKIKVTSVNGAAGCSAACCGCLFQTVPSGRAVEGAPACCCSEKYRSNLIWIIPAKGHAS